MDGIWISGATFAITAISTLVGGGIAIGRQESRMQAMVAQARSEWDGKLGTAIEAQSKIQAQWQRETNAEIKGAIYDFGETGRAIREKISQVELFMRDNYIKRDSFYHGLTELASNVKILSENLDGRLIRMENKIDEGRQSQRDRGGT